MLREMRKGCVTTFKMNLENLERECSRDNENMHHISSYITACLKTRIILIVVSPPVL